MATVTATPETTTPNHEPAGAPSGLPEGEPYKLSADDYFRMVEADIIPSDRRVGLWEGRLYEKMAKKLRHSVMADKVSNAVRRVLPETWCVWTENPILVDNFTAPLPDLSIIRAPLDDYLKRNLVPKANEIGLVVEVAEASLRKNLTVSLQTYARAGLPYYWVVNLVAKRIEVYSDPKVEEGVARYAATAIFEVGNDVPLVLDGREVARIPARDLLPEETN